MKIANLTRHDVPGATPWPVIHSQSAYWLFWASTQEVEHLSEAEILEGISTVLQEVAEGGFDAVIIPRTEVLLSLAPAAMEIGLPMAVFKASPQGDLSLLGDPCGESFLDWHA